jgi:hypothetical protein
MKVSLLQKYLSELDPDAEVLLKGEYKMIPITGAKSFNNYLAEYSDNDLSDYYLDEDRV